ncbi:phosphohistidine phosphatase [Mangrovactinospora gilvigrisea]|uniref:Phosphohistidine phosphatase n=1 Tax=Mangrovactinospora gilvigrisea TaxID=1428644 RepID=A0A1J7CBN7_9ACTN|nr:histidine phosphatase family protein [Mangrovactinospora gilvigrisea]OIV38932.1 phosphohistidine phosphatase [Mangrovactinospora gilvigrisea]
MTAVPPRRIVVLRHAKADWPAVADHDRPLAERGRREAPAAGQWLAGAGIVPDLTLCSTAARTRETWKLVAHELPRRPKKTLYEDRLYEASTGELIALINQAPEEVHDLMLVGHNPGVQGLTELLAGSSEGDTLAQVRRGFPTAAVAVLSVDGPWKSVEPGSARLVSFAAPDSV